MLTQSLLLSSVIFILQRLVFAFNRSLAPRGSPFVNTVYTLVVLHLFHEQRLIKFWCFGGHVGCEAVLSSGIILTHHGAVWIAWIISRRESSSHKIVHDRPGLRPSIRIEHGQSKPSRSHQSLPALTIV